MTQTTPSRRIGLIFGILCASVPVMLWAQQSGFRNRVRTQQDPAQVQRAASNRLRDALEAGDDEWAILEAKLSKIQALQTPGTALQEKIQQLQAGLEDRTLPTQEIQRRMIAVRTARQEARTELDRLRGELIELLSTRQEAALLGMGILE